MASVCMLEPFLLSFFSALKRKSCLLYGVIIFLEDVVFVPQRSKSLISANTLRKQSKAKQSKAGWLEIFLLFSRISLYLRVSCLFFYPRRQRRRMSPLEQKDLELKNYYSDGRGERLRVSIFSAKQFGSHKTTRRHAANWGCFPSKLSFPTKGDGSLLRKKPIQVSQCR